MSGIEPPWWKVDRFAENMKHELTENSISKGVDWEGADSFYLCEEIEEHQRKLLDAITKGDKEKIREYAADIGNLAMMVADVEGALGEAYDT